MQAGSDVSASLTAWGSWQPSLAPTRGPTVLDALIGSLGSRGSNRVSNPETTCHEQNSLPAVTSYIMRGQGIVNNRSTLWYQRSRGRVRVRPGVDRKTGRNTTYLLAAYGPSDVLWATSFDCDQSATPLVIAPDAPSPLT